MRDKDYYRKLYQKMQGQENANLTRQRKLNSLGKGAKWIAQTWWNLGKATMAVVLGFVALIINLSGNDRH